MMLPPLFAKHRMGLFTQPDLVTRYTGEQHLQALYGQLPTGFTFENISTGIHQNQWVEMKGWAIHFRYRFGDFDNPVDIWDIDPSAYDDYDTFVEVWTYLPGEGCVDHYISDRNGLHHTRTQLDKRGGPLRLNMARDHEVKALIMACKIQAYVVTQPQEVSVLTGARNMPKVYQRQGDTVRYARLTELRTASGQARQRGYEPPEEPSGIRKREHAVRGHWVNRNGTKFWRRAHRRGDPELGSVTRVLS